MCGGKIKKRDIPMPEFMACPACQVPMQIQRLTRKALWRYRGQIYFCNACFELWSLKTPEFDPLDVERLSDDERDFDRMNRITGVMCENA